MVIAVFTPEYILSRQACFGKHVIYFVNILVVVFIDCVCMEFVCKHDDFFKFFCLHFSMHYFLVPLYLCMMFRYNPSWNMLIYVNVRSNVFLYINVHIHSAVVG